MQCSKVGLLCTGQGALAGAAVLGLGGLAFYGLGMGRELGAVDKQVAWPQYVKVSFSLHLISFSSPLALLSSRS